MADIQMPAGFGGLMRYKEEYNSKFKIGPGVVIALIIIVLVLVIGLKIWINNKTAATAALLPILLLKNVWRN